MKTIKKLCLLLLCLGVVGGAAACDMSMLSSMMGGESVESQVESTESEDVGSSEILNNDAIKDKWDQALQASKFNNVTFTYMVIFSGGCSHEDGQEDGVAYFDGDKVAFSENGSIPTLMTSEEIEAFRNIYIGTTLALLENSASFKLDNVTGRFASSEKIVYTVNVMGTEATITATDVSVAFDRDGNLFDISCNMRQDFVEDGEAKFFEMSANFTFTNYGTTVIYPDIVGGKPDSGNPDDGGKPEEDVTGGVVTNEGWLKVFENTMSATNFTLTVTDYRYYRDGTDAENRYTANFDGNTFMLTHGNKTQYYAQEGSGVYCYEEDDENIWVRSLYDEEVQFGQEAVTRIIQGFESSYFLFDYEEEPLGCYTAYNITAKNRYGIHETYYRVQIGIRDGYIYHITLEGDAKDEDGATVGGYRMMLAFTNRNTTEVILPTIDIETPGNPDSGETVPKEGVTEEGWREAFDNTFAADNYTLTITSNPSFIGGSQQYVAKFDGNALMFEQGNQILYYGKDGDEIYCYEQSDRHTWVKSLYEGEVYFGGAAAQLLFGVFRDLYSVFPYQGPHALDYYMSENLTVQYQDGHEETFHRVQIGIRDGYIYHINLEIAEKDENGNIVSSHRWMFAFSNRNTTVVTLPVDVETQVSTEEWNAAMEFAVNTNNVTAYMETTYDYDDDTLDNSSESWMALTENATHQWGTGHEQYYAKEDGVDYKYSLRKDGLWERSEVGVEVTYTNYRMASVIDPIRGLYENCGYNEEKGTYFLEAAEVDAGNGTMVTLRNIEIGFRDGMLTYLTFEMDMMNSEGEKTVTVKTVIAFWDYGTTEVDVPQVA